MLKLHYWESFGVPNLWCLRWGRCPSGRSEQTHWRDAAG